MTQGREINRYWIHMGTEENSVQNFGIGTVACHHTTFEW
jgi:hypothetical protein